MPDLVDPALAHTWLASARRATLGAQVALMFFAEAGTEIHLHSPELLAVLGVWVATDLGQSAWSRRRGVWPARGLQLTAALDLTALTAILLLSGGQHSPLLFGYLAYLALLAMVLPPAQAWGAALTAMVLQAVVVVHPADVAGLTPDEDSAAHLIGHIVTFDLSAAAITWVVTRLSAALRERNAEARAAEQTRAITERLAALGTLAAGVAHELGTPLGAIQLLGEQARRKNNDPTADAPLGTLLEQVARCRAILDRLRAGEAHGQAQSSFDIEAWVGDWRRASPEIDVRVGPSGAPEVLGLADSWRGAVWVALDNAKRAGARHVVVDLRSRDEGLELCIDDDGQGLAAGAAEHAGEPFWTGWGGTGLGLFVTRSFARSVGGDAWLEARDPAGARARFLIPRATP